VSEPWHAYEWVMSHHATPKTHPFVACTALCNTHAASEAPNLFVDESYAWQLPVTYVTRHIWLIHVTSCHTRLILSHMTHAVTYDSHPVTYDSPTRFISFRMSHVTSMNESCHIWLTSCHIWLTSCHIYLIPVTSCRAYDSSICGMHSSLQHPRCD